MPTSKAIGRPAIDYSFLHNSTVIVTGGASGLGAACVETFASHGAYVTIADLDEANGTRLATDLTAKGGHVAFAKCDTTDWASSVAAFKQAVNFGPSKTLDIAALFAGISGSNANIVDLVGRREEPTLDGDPGEMPSHKVIDINLNGVFLSTWLALYYFRLPRKTGSMQNGAERKESLVLIGSAAGYVSPGASSSAFVAVLTPLPGWTSIQYSLRSSKIRRTRYLSQYSWLSRPARRPRKSNHSGMGVHVYGQASPWH